MPGSRFIIGLVAIAFIGLGAAAIIQKNRTVAMGGNATPAPTLRLGLTQSATNSQDQDGDGLLDWAEAVWGTDPKNPDTDGDGYLDGEEIAKSYDPLRPGEARLSTKSGAAPPASDQNITQSLAATLAQQVIAQNQSQLTDPNQKVKDLAAPSFDEAGVARLLGEILAQEPTLQSSPAPVLLPPKSPEGKRYASLLASILDAELKPLATSVPAALEAAVVRGDTKTIDSIIQAHSRAIQRLGNLTPPAGWQQVHESEQRLLAESKRFFEDISRAKDDPLRAIMAMRRYPLLIQQATTLANTLKAIVQKT